MEHFRESLLILISTPIYIIVIGAEIFFSAFHHLQLYSKKGTLVNLYLMLLNMGLDIIMRTASLLILNYFFDFRIINSYPTVWIYWVALFLAEDFMYYWLHRIDHFCRLFWAVHVTHHSSEEFNLTVGFRSSVLQPLYRFIYFIPLSIVGFKAIDIMFIYSATQIFGILVHTQTVGKLGWLEYFLVTPSHHRVHHASNVCYLDRNMGMVLIIWDKLFGTFQRELENEPIKYGLTNNLHSNNPGKIVFHEWQAIAHDLKKKTSVKNKIMYLLGPPGWSHDGDCKTSAQLRKALLKKK